MSRKVKVLISALLVAVLLAVGATATVMAQGEEETTPPSEEAGENGLLERVADILGIEEEALINAFNQARQEMREAAFVDRLNQAVKDGLLTQEQADEIIEWWGQKPEFMEPSMVQRALRFRSSLRTRQQNGLGWGSCPRLPRLAD